MTNIQKKIATITASAALLLNSALPVFATTELVISGNGDSENTIKVEAEQQTGVSQTNEANIVNTISIKAETGENEAEDNTGGDVSIETGDVDVNSSITNTANSNTANVACCSTGDTSVKIEGNGAGSDNYVKLEVNDGEQDGAYISQMNDSHVVNSVSVKASTGENEAEDNTGGSVEIKTGDVTVDDISVSNSLNSNSARIAGNEGSSSVSAWITGNGSDSDNKIKLELEDNALIEQLNEAYVTNTVGVKAETGENEAEDNTGGEVVIETGDVDVKVALDTMANFNWADSDCGCLLEDVLAKISGNGEGSENKIKAELEGSNWVKQGNALTSGQLVNAVEVKASTGENEVEDSTGDPGCDPSIETGGVGVDLGVSNNVNYNVSGSDEMPDTEMPDWYDLLPDGVKLSFDWSTFFAFFGGFFHQG